MINFTVPGNQINVLLSLSPRIPIYKGCVMPGQIYRASSSYKKKCCINMGPEMCDFSFQLENYIQQ
jgi:hypothetical protein